MHNVRQVPRKVLKTSAIGLGFRDLANVNAWKGVFDPYIVSSDVMMFAMSPIDWPLLTRTLYPDLIPTLTFFNKKIYNSENKNI